MVRFLMVMGVGFLLLLTGCSALVAPVSKTGAEPTAVESTGPAGVDDPNVFVDVEKFQSALLLKLAARDSAAVESMMTEPFLYGWWRGEMMDQPPADAAHDLFNDQLGKEIKLAVVDNANLPELMGGVNPLAIPRPEANVVDAVVVSGWGKHGEDEAVLFIARNTDNSLRWHGTLVIQGGFTSPQTGGVEPFVNEQHGYSLFIPRGFEVLPPLPYETVFLAPESSEGGHRERGFINVEPAFGRTAEQAADAVKRNQPEGFQVEPATVMGIEGAQVFVLDGLVGQDPNRQVFFVHDDILYTMMFVPQDAADTKAKGQMEDLYATIINTFHFLPAHGEISPISTRDLNTIEMRMRDALIDRNPTYLASFMADSFMMATWRSEGMELAPREAAEQIINSYTAAGVTPVFDHFKDITSLIPGDYPVSVPAGESITLGYVSNLGPEGTDEAILFFAQRVDGSLYWRGALLAKGGF